MDKVKPSKDTKVYLDILQFFKDRGFKQLSAYVLSNDKYVIHLEQFVEELSQ